MKIRTGNKSTFLASPEGGTAEQSRTNHNRGMSHNNQNWKEIQVAVDPFIDCTQYLPSPLETVPISLVPRLSQRAVRSQTDAARMWSQDDAQPAHMYVISRWLTIEQCGAHNEANPWMKPFSKSWLNLSHSLHQLLFTLISKHLVRYGARTVVPDRMTEWLNDRMTNGLMLSFWTVTVELFSNNK